MTFNEKGSPPSCDDDRMSSNGSPSLLLTCIASDRSARQLELSSPRTLHRAETSYIIKDPACRHVSAHLGKQGEKANEIMLCSKLP